MAPTSRMDMLMSQCTFESMKKIHFGTAVFGAKISATCPLTIKVNLSVFFFNKYKEYCLVSQAGG